MSRVFHVAVREFVATVWSKGFMLGVLMTPFVILLVVVAVQWLVRTDGPAVSGEVAIIDRSGLVGERFARRLAPEALTEERERQMRAAQEQIGDALDRLELGERSAAAARSAADRAAQQAIPDPPALRVAVLATDADPDQHRRGLGSGRASDPDQRIALAVVPEGAVRAPEQGAAYEHPDLFVAPRLDFEVQSRIRATLQAAVIDARLEDSGFDIAAVRSIMATPHVRAAAVTPEGETRAAGELTAFLIPGAFMLLLWVSVFTAGQYLLTTTIEEKSSRVMEVLLSAVSPIQLMTGKILGQMGVGLLVLLMYSGLGLASLAVFAYLHLIAWTDVALLLVFFFIAFFIIAATMAAVGSAVTDLREAQSLMTPVMVILFIPMMLWMPIQRDPNSTFATVLSFTPLVNPFVMVLRVAGSEPVPAWQIGAAIAVGVATVLVMVWFAAKVFRIGVLMYGKPPDLRTLFRWIRMA